MEAKTAESMVMLKLGLVKHRRRLLPLDFLVQTQEALRIEGLLPPGAEPQADPLDLTHFHRTLDDAARQRGGPVFGLFLAEQLYPRLFSRMGHLLLSADNLLMAVRTLTHHSDGLGLVLRIQLAEEADHFRLIVDHRVALPDRPVLASELMLGLFWLVVSRYGSPLQDPIDVHIGHPVQGDRQSYQTFFGPGCTLHFNRDEDGLRFSRRDFTRLNPCRDPELYAALNQLVEQNFQSLVNFHQQQNLDWLVRIRAEMLAQLDQGGCSMDSLAEHLHLTPRTLQRKLAGYQLTYSLLLDQCRREKAVHYLQGGTLPPKALAAKLGFAGLPSLRRAFLRWFGTLPQALVARRSPGQSEAGA